MEHKEAWNISGLIHPWPHSGFRHVFSQAWWPHTECTSVKTSRCGRIRSLQTAETLKGYFIPATLQYWQTPTTNHSWLISSTFWPIFDWENNYLCYIWWWSSAGKEFLFNKIHIYSSEQQTSRRRGNCIHVSGEMIAHTQSHSVILYNTTYKWFFLDSPSPSNLFTFVFIPTITISISKYHTNVANNIIFNS